MDLGFWSQMCMHMHRVCMCIPIVCVRTLWVCVGMHEAFAPLHAQKPKPNKTEEKTKQKQEI